MPKISNKNIYDICIVGFGAGGLTTFVQVVDHAISENRKIAIAIFGNDLTAQGLAYGTGHRGHILNLSASIMNVAHYKKDDFLNWTRNNKQSLAKRYTEAEIESDFPPRVLFGEYLTHSFQDYLKKAQHSGIIVDCFELKVEDIKDADSSIKIITNLGDKYLTRNAILCLGNFPSTAYRNLFNEPNYFNSIYNIKATDLNKYKKVTILGTRLTAIDTVISLIEEFSYQGEITMISRSGKLPKIIGPYKPTKLNFITQTELERFIDINGHISLKKIAELFQSEIKTITGDSLCEIVNKDDESTQLELLESEIRLIDENTPRLWQSILIELYPIVPWIWSNLSKVDKNIFIREYYSNWLTYLAAFPLQNAKKVLGYLKSKKLIIKGGLENIEYDNLNNKFIVMSNNKSAYDADCVINATGSGHNYTGSVIINNLLKNDLIKSGNLSQILVDTSTCAVINRKRVKNIYAIGEPTFESWLATADLGQISRQAEKVVLNIFKNL